MPFTFSHPAIVLPFVYLPKRWYSLTGLVVGSMMPDFEYFIRMKIKSEFSHTLPGLFWFDLPLGVLIAFVFHNVVRDALINNLPKFFQTRFLPFQFFQWNEHFKRNWIVVLASVCVGAASHILWDNLTHEYGFFVDVIPTLQNTIEIEGRHPTLYKVLQYVSSLLGVAAILITIVLMPANQEVKNKDIHNYWLMCGLITGIVLIVRLQLVPSYTFYEYVIPTTIAGVLIAITITSAAEKLNYYRL